jgi:LuxR family maltose regulon positive regulatory protein
MDSQLLTTKLNIPRLRPNLVPRQRLTERVDEALHLGHRLLLVCTPAGFGKTTLLSEWIRVSGRPAAWVSLDENDNDPVTFWTHFIAALRTGLPNTAEATLGESLVTVPQSPASAHEGASFPMDVLLATLLSEIAELSVALVIILDDYHLIETQSIHDALAFLLEHLPLQMHLVIASRIDPPLPLARLRGRYQLTEVREADLRFTPVETNAFLSEAMGLGLTEDNVAALETSTEGWIVGLQLAALYLKGKEAARVEEFIQAFGGSHRHIIDYLVEEMLQQQTDEVREFLFQTAILNRLTAPLCDAVRFGCAETPSSSQGTAVTGRNDGQAMLTQLEQDNLFLVSLDERREWYRYHHLFADFLRFQARMQPRDLAVLHQRAAQWYEANGFMAEAIKHALAAGNTVDAARLIALAAEDTLRHARFVTFHRWLDALPGELVSSDLELATTMAWVLTQKGEPTAAEYYVRAAAKRLPVDVPQPARAKVIALQAMLPLFRGSPHDDRNEHMALFTVTLMGKTLLAQLQQATGEMQAGLKTVQEMCRQITEENAGRWSVLSARAVEANLLLKQGDVTAVAHWAESVGLSPTDNPSYVRMPIYLAYVRLLLAQKQLRDAHSLLSRMERQAQQDGRLGDLVTIHALQALTKQALGREDQAFSYLRRALTLAAPEDYYRSLLDEGLPLAELLFKAQAHPDESMDRVFVKNLLEAFRAELEYAPGQPSLLVEPLTPRELEVLALIVAGLSNRKSAAELVLAMGTVKKHITNIYGKLGIRRRAQAIARARELDLL